jgi:hypothetical protein
MFMVFHRLRIAKGEALPVKTAVCIAQTFFEALPHPSWYYAKRTSWNCAKPVFNVGLGKQLEGLIAEIGWG